MLDEQCKWQHVHYMRALRILHVCAKHTKQIERKSARACFKKQTV